MPDVGVPELLIIAVIVLLLFGPGKAADIGGALGKSIREFRRASNAPEDPSVGTSSAPPAIDSTQASTTMPSASDQSGNGLGASSAARYCVECGAGVGEAQKFCSNCGTRVGVLR